MRGLNQDSLVSSFELLWSDHLLGLMEGLLGTAMRWEIVNGLLILWIFPDSYYSHPIDEIACTLGRSKNPVLDTTLPISDPAVSYPDNDDSYVLVLQERLSAGCFIF